MGTYGLMSQKDYETMDKILDLVCATFPDEVINITEVGVHAGSTSRGIKSYLKSKGRGINHTAIDNQRDFKMGAPFPESRFIGGNSIEVYNEVEDKSQHLVFIDACHNYPMTMADFLVYSDKVKGSGFIALHDTGAHIKPFTDFQGMGSMDDPDMWIACRKAVTKLGLLNNTFPSWHLVMDEYDDSLHTGGILLVQNIYHSLSEVVEEYAKKAEGSDKEYYNKMMQIQ